MDNELRDAIKAALARLGSDTYGPDDYAEEASAVLAVVDPELARIREENERLSRLLEEPQDWEDQARSLIDKIIELRIAAELIPRSSTGIDFVCRDLSCPSGAHPLGAAPTVCELCAAVRAAVAEKLGRLTSRG